MATFWREVPVPAVPVHQTVHPTPPGLVPLGTSGNSNSSRCSPEPSLQLWGGHPQVTEVSCNTSSTAFNWEHSKPCLILSLSKSFPALWEPQVSRCVSIPLTKPSQKSTTTTLQAQGDPSSPLQSYSPSFTRASWGDCGDHLLQASFSAPQFPSHPVSPLLQQSLNQKQGCSDPNPSHSAPKATVI